MQETLEVKKPVVVVDYEEQRFKSERDFKRIAYIHPGVHRTSEINMPKRQSCPEHGGACKRVRKTVTGAFYHCRFCGDFFVPQPESRKAMDEKVSAGVK